MADCPIWPVAAALVLLLPVKVRPAEGASVITRQRHFVPARLGGSSAERRVSKNAGIDEEDTGDAVLSPELVQSPEVRGAHMV